MLNASSFSLKSAANYRRAYWRYSALHYLYVGLNGIEQPTLGFSCLFASTCGERLTTTARFASTSSFSETRAWSVPSTSTSPVAGSVSVVGFMIMGEG